MKVKINSITLSKNILIVREQHKVSNLKESTRKMIFIIEYIAVSTAFFITCFFRLLYKLKEYVKYRTL